MIDLVELRRSGATPRVHGNGFIQLDLDDRRRLHVWGDRRIPRQGVATPIHDHVFGFISKVLVGRLINVVYNFEAHPHGEFVVYEAVDNGPKASSVLEPTDVQGDLSVKYAQMTCVSELGDSYVVLPGQIHESFAPDGPTVTVITKDGPTMAQGGGAPRVFIPRHLKPDNTFDRYGYTEDQLWYLMGDALKGVVR